MDTVRHNIVSAIVLIMGVALWLFPLLVYAEADPKITIVDAPDFDRGSADMICTTVNTNVAEILGKTAEENFAFFVNESNKNDVVITIKMSVYRGSSVTQEQRQQIMQSVLTTIQNSQMSRSNRNKLYNELCKLDETTSSLVRQLSNDVKADYVGAYATFRPFSGVFGWIFGLLTFGMFMILGLTMIIDIAFINLPFMQLMLMKNNGDKPKFVSIEAVSAVKESADKAGSEYVEPNGVYLKRKGKQIFMVSLCILYLSSGKLYEVVAIIIDYFRGFVG